MASLDELLQTQTFKNLDDTGKSKFVDNYFNANLVPTQTYQGLDDVGKQKFRANFDTDVSAQTATPLQTFGRALAQVPAETKASFQAGLGSTGAPALDKISTVSPDSPLFGASGEAALSSKTLEAGLAGIQKLKNEQAQKTLDEAQVAHPIDPTRTSAKIASALGNVVPVVATMVASRFAPPLAPVANDLLLGAIGLQQYGSTMKELGQRETDTGVQTTTASKEAKALLSSSINIGLMTAGMKGLDVSADWVTPSVLRVVGKKLAEGEIATAKGLLVRRLVADAAGSAASWGALGVAQTAADNFIKVTLSKPYYKDLRVMDGTPDAFVYSALAGVFAGSVIAGSEAAIMYPKVRDNLVTMHKTGQSAAIAAQVGGLRDMGYSDEQIAHGLQGFLGEKMLYPLQPTEIVKIFGDAYGQAKGEVAKTAATPEVQALLTPKTPVGPVAPVVDTGLSPDLQAKMNNVTVQEGEDLTGKSVRFISPSSPEPIVGNVIRKGTGDEWVVHDPSIDKDVSIPREHLGVEGVQPPVSTSVDQASQQEEAQPTAISTVTPSDRTPYEEGPTKAEQYKAKLETERKAKEDKAYEAGVQLSKDGKSVTPSAIARVLGVAHPERAGKYLDPAIERLKADNIPLVPAKESGGVSSSEAKSPPSTDETRPTALSKTARVKALNVVFDKDSRSFALDEKPTADVLSKQLDILTQQNVLTPEEAQKIRDNQGKRLQAEGLTRQNAADIYSEALRELGANDKVKLEQPAPVDQAKLDRQAAKEEKARQKVVAYEERKAAQIQAEQDKADAAAKKQLADHEPTAAEVEAANAGLESVEEAPAVTSKQVAKIVIKDHNLSAAVKNILGAVVSDRSLVAQGKGETPRLHKGQQIPASERLPQAEQSLLLTLDKAGVGQEVANTILEHPEDFSMSVETGVLETKSEKSKAAFNPTFQVFTGVPSPQQVAEIIGDVKRGITSLVETDYVGIARHLLTGGQALYASGMTKFRTWAQQMVVEFGSQVKPLLSRLWNYIKEIQPGLSLKIIAPQSGEPTPEQKRYLLSELNKAIEVYDRDLPEDEKLHFFTPEAGDPFDEFVGPHQSYRDVVIDIMCFTNDMDQTTVENILDRVGISGESTNSATIESDNWLFGYHSSKAKFPQFDMNKLQDASIGEGTNYYGVGGYLSGLEAKQARAFYQDFAKAKAGDPGPQYGKKEELLRLEIEKGNTKLIDFLLQSKWADVMLGPDYMFGLFYRAFRSGLDPFGSLNEGAGNKISALEDRMTSELGSSLATPKREQWSRDHQDEIYKIMEEVPREKLARWILNDQNSTEIYSLAIKFLPMKENFPSAYEYLMAVKKTGDIPVWNARIPDGMRPKLLRAFRNAIKEVGKISGSDPKTEAALIRQFDQYVFHTGTAPRYYLYTMVADQLLSEATLGSTSSAAARLDAFLNGMLTNKEFFGGWDSHNMVRHGTWGATDLETAKLLNKKLVEQGVFAHAVPAGFSSFNNRGAPYNYVFYTDDPENLKVLDRRNLSRGVGTRKMDADRFEKLAPRFAKALRETVFYLKKEGGFLDLGASTNPDTKSAPKTQREKAIDERTARADELSTLSDPTLEALSRRAGHASWTDLLHSEVTRETEGGNLAPMKLGEQVKMKLANVYATSKDKSPTILEVLPPKYRQIALGTEEGVKTERELLVAAPPAREQEVSAQSEIQKEHLLDNYLPQLGWTREKQAAEVQRLQDLGDKRKNFSVEMLPLADQKKLNTWIYDQREKGILMQDAQDQRDATNQKVAAAQQVGEHPYPTNRGKTPVREDVRLVGRVGTQIPEEIWLEHFRNPHPDVATIPHSDIWEHVDKLEYDARERKDKHLVQAYQEIQKDFPQFRSLREASAYFNSNKSLRVVDLGDGRTFEGTAAHIQGVILASEDPGSKSAVFAGERWGFPNDPKATTAGDPAVKAEDVPALQNSLTAEELKGLDALRRIFLLNTQGAWEGSSKLPPVEAFNLQSTLARLWGKYYPRYILGKGVVGERNLQSMIVGKFPFLPDPADSGRFEVREKGASQVLQITDAWKVADDLTNTIASFVGTRDAVQELWSLVKDPEGVFKKVKNTTAGQDQVISLTHSIQDLAGSPLRYERSRLSSVMSRLLKRFAPTLIAANPSPMLVHGMGVVAMATRVPLRYLLQGLTNYRPNQSVPAFTEQSSQIYRRVNSDIIRTLTTAPEEEKLSSKGERLTNTLMGGYKVVDNWMMGVVYEAALARAADLGQTPAQAAEWAVRKVINPTLATPGGSAQSELARTARAGELVSQVSSMFAQYAIKLHSNYRIETLTFKESSKSPADIRRMIMAQVSLGVVMTLGISTLRALGSFLIKAPGALLRKRSIGDVLNEVNPFTVPKMTSSALETSAILALGPYGTLISGIIEPMLAAGFQKAGIDAKYSSKEGNLIQDFEKQIANLGTSTAGLIAMAITGIRKLAGVNDRMKMNPKDAKDTVVKFGTDLGKLLAEGYGFPTTPFRVVAGVQQKDRGYYYDMVFKATRHSNGIMLQEPNTKTANYAMEKLLGMGVTGPDFVAAMVQRERR